MINGCPNPQLVTLFTYKGLQFIKVANLRNFLRLRCLWQLMSCRTNPTHDRSVMNLGDSFYAPQSHTIEIHFDAQLLNLPRITPRTVGFQKLPTALLALVALSDECVVRF